MVIICIFISSLLMILFFFLIEITPSNNDKNLSFECGYETLSENNITFSTNFVILMIIFLIFDVEISILIPFLIINNNNQTNITLLSSIFIIILISVTINEWKQGSIEWAN